MTMEMYTLSGRVFETNHQRQTSRASRSSMSCSLMTTLSDLGHRRGDYGDRR